MSDDHTVAGASCGGGSCGGGDDSCGGGGSCGGKCADCGEATRANAMVWARTQADTHPGMSEFWRQALIEDSYQRTTGETPRDSAKNYLRVLPVVQGMHSKLSGGSPNPGDLLVNLRSFMEANAVVMSQSPFVRRLVVSINATPP